MCNFAVPVAILKCSFHLTLAISRWINLVNLFQFLNMALDCEFIKKMKFIEKQNI